MIFNCFNKQKKYITRVYGLLILRDSLHENKREWLEIIFLSSSLHLKMVKTTEAYYVHTLLRASARGVVKCFQSNQVSCIKLSISLWIKGLKVLWSISKIYDISLLSAVVCLKKSFMLDSRGEVLLSFGGWVGEIPKLIIYIKCIHSLNCLFQMFIIKNDFI